MVAIKRADRYIGNLTKNLICHMVALKSAAKNQKTYLLHGSSFFACFYFNHISNAINCIAELYINYFSKISYLFS